MERACRPSGVGPPGRRSRCVRLSRGRLHLQDGPIDLVLRVWGPAAPMERACEHAAGRFRGILDELVGELPVLRAPVSDLEPSGRVARRMWDASRRFGPRFTTPMIAVAGSVADEILAIVRAVAGVDACYVNNGGDIAVFPGARGLRVGVLPPGRTLAGMPAVTTITRCSGIGGVATSGWQGRSHSLGIADSVTVLARTAAMADSAATLIANEVDVDDAGIERRPAVEIDPDSDLGNLPVTVAVAPLEPKARERALDRGRSTALEFLERGLITSAFILLQGCTAGVGDRVRANRAPGKAHTEIPAL